MMRSEKNMSYVSKGKLEVLDTRYKKIQIRRNQCFENHFKHVHHNPIY